MFRRFMLIAVAAASITVLAPPPESHAGNFAGCFARFYIQIYEISRRNRLNMSDDWMVQSAYDLCTEIYRK